MRSGHCGVVGAANLEATKLDSLFPGGRLKPSAVAWSTQPTVLRRGLKACFPKERPKPSAACTANLLPGKEKVRVG